MNTYTSLQPRKIKTLLACLTLAALAAGTLPKASAASTNYIWSGGGTDTLWGTAGNWVAPSPVAASFNRTNEVTFYYGAGGNFDNVLGVDRTMRALNFSNATSAVTIEMRNTAIGTTQRYLNFDTSLSQSNAWLRVDSQSTAALTVGVSQGWVGLVTNLTIDHQGSGVLTIGRPIWTNALRDASVTKTGPGFLVLSAANKFSGGMTIQGGPVGMGNNGCFGTGQLAIGAPGVLLTNTAASGNRILNISSVAVNGDFTYDAAGGGNLNFGLGTATLGNNCAITVNVGNVVFTNTINESGGSYGITKLGPGQLNLYGANTYTGPTRVGQGILYWYNYASSQSSIILSNFTQMNTVVNTNGAASLELPSLTEGTAETDILTNQFGLQTFGNPPEGVPMIHTASLVLNSTNIQVILGKNASGPLSVGTITLIKYDTVSPANVLLTSFPF